MVFHYVLSCSNVFSLTRKPVDYSEFICSKSCHVLHPRELSRSHMSYDSPALVCGWRWSCTCRIYLPYEIRNGDYTVKNSGLLAKLTSAFSPTPLVCYCFCHLMLFTHFVQISGTSPWRRNPSSLLELNTSSQPPDMVLGRWRPTTHWWPKKLYLSKVE
jgi:hypothetical protein